MDGKPIPGFYYDPHKKKYFKILPDHIAPSGSPHSVSNVRKAELESKTREAASKENSRNSRQRVKRSRISYTAGFYDYGLGREIGHSRSKSRLKDSCIKAFTITWSMRRLFRLVDDTFTVFAWDEATEGFLLSTKLTRCLQSVVLDDPTHELNSACLKIPIDSSENEISSISIGPSRMTAITTYGDPDPPTIAFATLRDPDRGTLEWQRASTSVLQSTPWDCAVSPFQSPEEAEVECDIAIAQSEQLLIARIEPDDCGYLLKMSTDSDVLSVSWLTPHIVAAGQRNGIINLCDVRSKGHAQRLQLPGAVVSLRCVDEHRLVAAAVPHSLAMYDLRMPIVKELRKRTEPRGNKRKHGESMHHQQDVSITVPSVNYAGYRNASAARLGLDVNPQLDLVAAGNSEEDIVQVWSLSRGSIMTKFNPSALLDSGTITGPFSTLEFVDGPPDEITLYGCSGNSMYEFTCDGRNEWPMD